MYGEGCGSSRPKNSVDSSPANCAQLLLAFGIIHRRDSGPGYFWMDSTPDYSPTCCKQIHIVTAGIAIIVLTLL